jgi:CRP-like cAMP-binding protein
MEKIWYMSHLDLFEGISEEEVHAIAERAVDIQTSSRKVLYTPFDGNDRRVFIVKEGEVVLYHSSNGKRTVFDVLGPGMLFGNFLPHAESVSHFAELLPGSRICTFPPEDLQRVVAVHPEVLARLLGKLTERIRDYEERLQLDTTSAQEKVLGELKRYARKKRNLFSWFRGDAPLALSHERIGEFTGLNRVTVTRAIKVLKHRELITVDAQGRILLKH